MEIKMGLKMKMEMGFYLEMETDIPPLSIFKPPNNQILLLYSTLLYMYSNPTRLFQPAYSNPPSPTRPCLPISMAIPTSMPTSTPMPMPIYAYLPIPIPIPPANIFFPALPFSVELYSTLLSLSPLLALHCSLEQLVNLSTSQLVNLSTSHIPGVRMYVSTFRFDVSHILTIPWPYIHIIYTHIHTYIHTIHIHEPRLMELNLSFNQSPSYLPPPPFPAGDII